MERVAKLVFGYTAQQTNPRYPTFIIARQFACDTTTPAPLGALKPLARTLYSAQDESAGKPANLTEANMLLYVKQGEESNSDIITY